MDKVILNESFEKIEVVVNKNTSSSLYLYIKDKASLNCKITLQQNSHLNFLSWNESEEFNVDCVVSCAKDAHVTLNFGELSDGTVNANYKIYLEEEGSSLNLRSATTVETSKHIDIECKHLAPHTESNMENYAVVYEKADYKMVDTGTIVKGAYGSSSHQACYDEINKKYELRKVQILQFSDDKTAAEVQTAIKSGELTFEDALVQYKDKLTTTTFTGKEQVITNTVSLTKDAIKNIWAAKDNTVLDQYQYSSDLKSFYVVKVISTDVSLEDGKATLLGVSTIANDAMAYYLAKYNFTIYDIDLYNGLKAQSSSYIVQD